MKFVYTILIVGLVLLWGCKQDLEIATSHYKDIPVVYSLLNLHDYGNDGNTHYIRIQKGYLLKGNAYTATGIIDSIYYDSLKVQLVSSQPGISPITLTRIDGSTVGLNKDTGIFATTPNYLYTFHSALSGSQTYTLLVMKTNGDTLATAVDSIVNNFNIYSPSRVGGSSIAFSNSQPQVLTWGNAQNGSVYDLTVRFYYKEFTVTPATENDTYIDIPIFQSFFPPNDGSSNITFSLTSSLITSYLANNLTADPNIYREFNFQKGMQFKFAAGGNALAQYFLQQQAQTGLTSSNALPTYTNISGGGVGVFSSRNYQEIDSIVLTPNGLDSLACDPNASKLNFLNSVGRTCN